MSKLQKLRDEAASCTRCDLYRSWRGLVVGTIHPSAVLRGPDAESRDRAYAGLVSDLVLARETAAKAGTR